MRKEHILGIPDHVANSLAEKLQSKKFASESVGVVESYVYHKLDRFSWFGPRFMMENNQFFKHIIPYVVIEHNGDILMYKRSNAGGESRLHDMFSIGWGGHIELYSDVCHVGDSFDFRRTINNSILRELTEEIGLESDISSWVFLGVINKNRKLFTNEFQHDGEVDVNDVHFGLVFRLSVGSKFAKLTGYNRQEDDDSITTWNHELGKTSDDDGIREYQWVSLDGLGGDIQLEPWSQDVVKMLRQNR